MRAFRARAGAASRLHGRKETLIRNGIVSKIFAIARAIEPHGLRSQPSPARGMRR
jgi:hypothetical protein